MAFHIEVIFIGYIANRYHVGLITTNAGQMLAAAVEQRVTEAAKALIALIAEPGHEGYLNVSGF